MLIKITGASVKFIGYAQGSNPLLFYILFRILEDRAFDSHPELRIFPELSGIRIPILPNSILPNGTPFTNTHCLAF